MFAFTLYLVLFTSSLSLACKISISCILRCSCYISDGGDKTYCFMHARQVLYHQATPPTPNCMFVFDSEWHLCLQIV
jgi:hypothetical protein